MTATVVNFDFRRACRDVGLSLDEIRVAMDREIRRLDAETAAKRSRIEAYLTRIDDDLEHLRPSDVGTPS